MLLDLFRSIFGVFSDPEVYKDPIEDVSKTIETEPNWQDIVKDAPPEVFDMSKPKEGPFPSWSEEAMKSVTQKSPYFNEIKIEKTSKKKES